MRARRAALGAPALVLAALGGLLLSAPARAAQTGSVNVLDAVEAWYSDAPTAPPCPLPLGCPTQAPTSPYPKDTLHVGVAAGKETARTYVLPDLTTLPIGAIADGGSMVLPLATTSAGTVNASAAHIKACLATKLIPADTAGADVKTAPPYDCAVSALVVYSAASGAFTLPLTPFLQAWATGQIPYGIALIPDSAATKSTDVWQVAFSGRNRAGFLKISSTITYTVPATPTLPPVPPPAPVAAPPQVNVPAPAQLPQPQSVAPPTTVPPNPQVAAPPPARTVAFRVQHFQYPMVFLFPLLLLGAGIFLIRVFTRDARPWRPPA
jgi:hypothetical protein